MKGLGAAIALLLAIAPVAPRAQPAGDWGATRNPFDKNVIARYKAVLATKPHDAGALAKLLAMYRRHRTIDALVDEYRKQLERSPSDWASHVVLGRLLRSRGDAAGARGAWATAVALRSSDSQTWIAIGELDKSAGNHAEARAAYDRALAHAQGNAAKKAVLRSLASLAVATGDSEGADAYFRQFLDIDPNNAPLWIDRGDAMLAAGNPRIALDSYQAAEKLLSRDPARRIEVVARRGQAFETIGDADQAVAEYRRAIKLAPKGYFLEVELTDRIIDIHRKNQTLPDLLAQYEKDWPENTRRHFEWQTLGKLYEETGAQEKAIAALKRAVAASGGELDTQRRLIALLDNSGRDDEALAQYEAVARAAPGEQRLQLELAERYWRRGQHDKALASLRRLEQRFPNDPGVLASIASLYQVFGKDDLAIAQYERLVRIEPNDANHLVALGEQYFQRGDKIRAMATWKRIAASKKPSALAKLGQVLSDHGAAYYAEAEKNFAAAIAAEPANVEFHKGLAALYDARKDYKNSLGEWDTVMRLIGRTPADRAARRDNRRRLVTALGRLPTVEIRRIRTWEAALNTADLAAGRFNQDAVEAAYCLVEYFGRPGKSRSGEPIATLEKLVAMVPEDIDAAIDLVKAYRIARKFDASVALALKVAAAVPTREREMYKLVSEIKSETRRDEEAIAWQQKALAKSPHDPSAYVSLGDRYAALQKLPEAITAYERALKLDPRNSKTAFALVQLYVQTGTPEKANHILRDVLRNETDEDAIARAGDQAIDLAELTDTLGKLEQVVSPLSFVMAHKAVYRRILVALYLRHVPALVDRTRRGGEEGKTAARLELKRIGARGLRPLLEALRDDKDSAQQRAAVQVLGYLGNKGAALPLVRLARQEPTKDSLRIGTIAETLDRRLAVDALVAAGRLRDPRVVAEVLPLVDHPELSVREAATFALGRSADRRAVAPLIKLLADHQPSVRVLACLGLAQISDARVGPALIAMVSDPEGHGLPPGRARRNTSRPAKLSSPEQIVSAPGATDRVPRQGLSRVAVPVGTATEGVRTKATSCPGCEAAADRLMFRRALSADRVRAACAYAIGAREISAGTPALLAAVDDNRSESLRLAAWALGQLGDRRAMDGLVRAYFARAGAPMEEVVWAIGRVAGQIASPAPLLGLDNYPIRGGKFDVATAMSQLIGPLPAPPRNAQFAIDHKDVIAAGIVAALSEHRDVGVSVLRDLNRAPDRLALGAFTPPDDDAGSPARDGAKSAKALDDIGLAIEPAVTRHTRAEDPKTRALAVMVLAKMNRGDDLIAQAMTDASPQVRASAMMSAGILAQRRGAPPAALAAALVSALRSSRWEDRRVAAISLGQLGSATDIEALVAAAGDKSSFVRQAVAVALGSFAERSSGAALRALAKDPVPQVRDAANRSLQQRAR